MAEPNSTPVVENTAIFEEMDNYNWEQDNEFMTGLRAVLGNANSPTQINDLTLHAKCFYMTRKKGIPISYPAYKAHLENQSGNHLNGVEGTPPQATTPTRSDSSPMASNSSAASSPPADAPYPPTFAEIVALIHAGAPIPGIIDIPETVLPGRATQASERKRRKPWEVDVSEEMLQGAGTQLENGEVVEGMFGDAARDRVIVQELPE